MNIDEVIRSARECHQAGHLQQAEPIYREILKRHPGNAEEYNSLGNVSGPGKVS